MGFFDRRPVPADVNTATAVGDLANLERSTHRTREGRRYEKGAASGVVKHDTFIPDKRPNFGQWIKIAWPDIVTMAIMGVIGLGVCSNDLVSLVSCHVD